MNDLPRRPLNLTYRWMPFGHARHCVDGELAPGATGATYCGETIEMPTAYPTYTEWLSPTCLRCYEVATTKQPAAAMDWECCKPTVPTPVRQKRGVPNHR